MISVSKAKMLLFTKCIPISLSILLILLLWSSILIAQNQQIITRTQSSLQSNNIQSYGPVAANEDFWGIAEKLRKDHDNSTEQMALALFNRNPGAFSHNNINGLIAGTILKVPDYNEVAKFSRQEAFALFQQHWQSWQKFRIKASEATIVDDGVKSIPAKPELKTQQKSLFTAKNTAFEYLPPDDTRAAVQSDYQFSVTLMDKPLVPMFLSWLKDNLMKSPLLIILFGVFAFVGLVMFFREQEKELFLLQSQLDDLSRSVKNSSTDSSPGTDIDIEHTSDKPFSDTPFINEPIATQETMPKVQKNIYKPVDIGKFVHPKSKNTSKKKINILESVFNQDKFSTGVGFIQNELSADNKQSMPVQPTIEESEECSLLNSVDEIRYVNETTRKANIEAFWSMTESYEMGEEELMKEFSSFQDEDKIEVFITEFEKIMATLSQQTPAIEQAPDEMENIVQFKLSVHFIKALSDMMQATHLKSFSSTVIEFLENIINGKTGMSNDVSRRLLTVVSCYNHYIHSLKNIHLYK